MSRKSMTEDEIAELSDDELSQMAIPPQLPEKEEEEEEVKEPETEEPVQAAEAPAKEEKETELEPEEEKEEEKEEESDEDLSDEEFSSREKPTKSDKSEEPVKSSEPGSKDSKDKAPKTDKSVVEDPEVKTPEESKEEPVKIDYEAEYKRIMAPFKANGKEMRLESVTDVVQLMQMGANYNKKMASLQPSLKLLRMLENNGLLDEGKLSYLIDLDKKNPEAVQKFVRESGIDPLEIDTSAEPTYKATDYRVSDQEMAFTTTLQEVILNPAGKEMVVQIDKTWDQQSKDALYTDPNIIRVLTEQKQTGLYDQIVSEVERRKVLGYLGNTSFLQAYHDVGHDMHKQGLLKPIASDPVVQAKSDPPAAQPSRVIDSRPAPKRTVTNNDQAKAASPTRASPTKVVQDFNPLALSDEEFEKHSKLAQRM